MATLHWLSDSNGDFSDGADWSGGAPPGSSDDAILDAPGSNPYTVTVTAAESVNSIQTAPTALLNILNNFTAINGTGSGANAGAIQIQNGGTLFLQGTVNNSGSIEIFGVVSPTAIELGAGGVTLTGGGDIVLNFIGGPDQQILAAPGGSVLTDVSERITGQGMIGGAGLSIVIDANGFFEAKGGLLTIDTGANTIINDGIINAEGEPTYQYTPGQGLVLSPVDNNGLIQANGYGSTMTFDGPVTGSGRAVITNGTLTFDSTVDQAVDFNAQSGALVLARSVNYASVIEQFTTTGSESIDLRDIAYTGPDQASYSGNTTDGRLTVSDGTHTAVIRFEGDYTTTVFYAASDGSGGTLITDGPRAIAWQNPVDGSLSDAADWSGGLAPGAMNDAVLNATGGDFIVTADGAAVLNGIQMASNATLAVTGTLTATNGTDGGTAAGVISVANGALLAAGGALDLTGQTFLSATTGHATLSVDNSLTLSGGGEIAMSDASGNIIAGSSTSVILTNASDLISGAGDLGDGKLSLINEAAGRIGSNGPLAALIINTGANTITNEGLIFAGGAGMTIASPLLNNGHLQTDAATLRVTGSVTGSGMVFIAGGTAHFTGAFNQRVEFGAAGGVLWLAQSAGFTSIVQGYAANGKDILDLGDIHFTGAGEAKFSGNASAGVLTVSDGYHTARVSLHGALGGVTFVASSDGHGGTLVTGIESSALSFLAAMAGLVGGPAPEPGPGPVASGSPQPAPVLGSPVHS